MRKNLMYNRGMIYSDIIIGLILLLAIIVVSVGTYNFFERRISRLSCEANMVTLQRAIERSRGLFEELPVLENGLIDIQALKDKGLIALEPVCPKKGSYILDEQGEVFCSFHGYRGGERR